MKIRAILPVLMVILLTHPAQTQEVPNDKKIHISLFAGPSALGPKSDIEDQMVASGLDDTNTLIGSVEHPRSNTYPVFDLEATYYTKENQGLSLNLALANFIEVDGFEQTDPNSLLGNFIFMNSKIWSVSFNYVYSSSSKRHQLATGPSLIIHHAKDTAKGNTSPTFSNVKPGLYAGYSFNIIHKKSWFLLFKTNYRWAPDSEIGPFVAEGFGGAEDSTFPATKVSLGVLNFGFGVGMRFGD